MPFDVQQIQVAHHAMNRHIERHLLLCFRDNDQVRIGVYNHAIADV